MSTSVRLGLIAVLIAVDMGGRVLPTFLARLLETDLVPVAASLLLNPLANSEVIPAATPFLLYGYLVYTLTPRLFPDRLGHVTLRRDFRLIVTGHVLLVPLLTFSGGGEWDALLLSGLVALPVYLIVVQRGAFLGRNGYPVVVMSALLPFSEFREGFEDDSDVQNRTLSFWIALTTFSFLSVGYSWVVLLFVGVGLFFFSVIFPIPEFLLSGCVGQRALLRGSFGPDEKILNRSQLDLETRVLSVVNAAFQGVKRFSSVGMAGAGLGYGVVILWISISNLGAVVDLATRSSTVSLARLLMLVVGTVTLCVVGLYGVWYWVRILTRVPPFLNAWLAGHTSKAEAEPTREGWALPTRPPGYFVPPLLLLFVYPAMEGGAWESTHLPSAGAILAWLGALGLILWTVYRGFMSTPQSACTEQRALPVSFFFLAVGAWIWPDLLTDGTYDLSSSYVVGLLTGRVSVNQLLTVLATPADTLSLALVTLPLYGFWIEDVLKWRDRDGWWGYAYVPYLLLAVLASGVVAVLTREFWQTVSFAVCAAALFGVTLLAILIDLNVVNTDWE